MQMAPACPPGAVMSFLCTSTASRVTHGDGEVAGWGTKAMKSQPSVKRPMITQRGGFHFVRNVTGLPRSPTRSPCGRSQTRKYETVPEDSQIILRFVHSAGSAHMRDEPAPNPHQTFKKTGLEISMCVASPSAQNILRIPFPYISSFKQLLRKF